MVFLLKEKELGATRAKSHYKPMLATRLILAKKVKVGAAIRFLNTSWR